MTIYMNEVHFQRVYTYTAVYARPQSIMIYLFVLSHAQWQTLYTYSEVHYSSIIFSFVPRPSFT